MENKKKVYYDKPIKQPWTQQKEDPIDYEDKIDSEEEDTHNNW
jgi:hypothetical protein